MCCKFTILPVYILFGMKKVNFYVFSESPWAGQTEKKLTTSVTTAAHTYYDFFFSFGGEVCPYTTVKNKRCYVSRIIRHPCSLVA